jgi:hypothetical protein
LNPNRRIDASSAAGRTTGRASAARRDLSWRTVPEESIVPRLPVAQIPAWPQLATGTAVAARRRLALDATGGAMAHPLTTASRIAGH